MEALLDQFSYGLFFWQFIILLIVIFILGKFAWKPIIGALEERERNIDSALNKAELARQEMARLTAQNEELMKQARAERDLILKEAKTLKDKMLAEAKTSAQTEGAKLIDKAKIEIENQKKAALTELKSQVSNLSLEIAERVLRTELADKGKQQELVNDLLKDVKLN